MVGPGGKEDEGMEGGGKKHLPAAPWRNAMPHSSLVSLPAWKRDAPNLHFDLVHA